MKVAVTDFTFDSLDLEKAILEPLGCQVDGRHCQTPEELINLVADADAVITQFAKLDAEVIAAMGRARAIVRYGIGVDNVDIQAAKVKGIPVCNVPDYCIDEVADHTLALILALTRQLFPNHREICQGRWRLAVPLNALRAIKELEVGIVGFGRIGREVFRRLQVFHCRISVFDPGVDPAIIKEAGGVPLGFEELLRCADLITLHCPSTPQTRRLFNRETLAKLKRGAILINVARGDVVDTAALIEASRNGHLGGVGLDVCDPEPVPPNSPLLALDNIIFSPHIASASVPAVTALRTQVAQTAARAIRGEHLPNVVNGVRA